MLNFERSKIGDYWRLFASAFNFKRHIGTIDTFEKIEDFAITRSAFIAQKTLFGYVKTRMGTRYPDMFKDDVLIRSINIAKMHVYAACLSDLTIWTVAVAYTHIDMPDSQRVQISESVFRNGLELNLDTSVSEFSVEDACRTFRTRLQTVDWHGAALTRDNFTESPPAVVKWAPIADSLKKYDVEYVENSVKFAWNNIRRQFIKRLSTDALVEAATVSRAQGLTGETLPS